VRRFSDRILIWSPEVFTCADRQETGMGIGEWKYGEWIKLALDEVNWRDVVNTVMNNRVL
jgi:hypothetical protein